MRKQDFLGDEKLSHHSYFLKKVNKEDIFDPVKGSKSKDDVKMMICKAPVASPGGTAMKAHAKDVASSSKMNCRLWVDDCPSPKVAHSAGQVGELKV